jgi:cytochrome b
MPNTYSALGSSTDGALRKISQPGGASSAIVAVPRWNEEQHGMSDPTGSPQSAAGAVRVWDLPTRVFHWLLALAVVAQVFTGKVGGAAMEWHFRIGYCIFALLGFRLVWGVIGGHWSRFSSFLYAPQTVLRYLRGTSRPGDHFEVGHNPLGSGSVFAMLGLLALQVAAGLVADDEISNVGPLNRYVSGALAASATAWHKGPGQALLITLIVLHIAAIAYYRLRKGQNLVQPMITGDKVLPAGTQGSVDNRLTRVQALAVILACAGIVGAVVKLGA